MGADKIDKAFVDRLTLLMCGEKPYKWATKIGMTQGTFNRMWKDAITPKADMLLLISEKTGCSIDWLLTGKGPMKLSEAGYPLSESEKNGDKIGEAPGGDLKADKDTNIADRSPVKAAAVSYIDAMTDYEASGVINYILSKQVSERAPQVELIEDGRFDFLNNLTPAERIELLAILDRRIEQAIEYESRPDASIERRRAGS